MKKVCVFLLPILVFFSCAKVEGEGGLNTISGYVMFQDIDNDLNPMGKPYVAQDEDVYIKYGADSKVVDDNTSTSEEGYYEFNYLLAGDYTIFAYSDDTLNVGSQAQQAFKQNVSIGGRKETVQVDTILLYNFADFNDGTATITGTVKTVSYYNPGSPKDTIPAQDQEVFLVYKDKPGVLDRVRTAHDGTYRFDKIYMGNYKVYVLSEEVASDKDAIVSALVTVKPDTKNI